MSTPPLSLTVALAPALAALHPTDLCLVVDVLRATSTLAVLFAQGCEAVWLAPDVATARQAIHRLPTALLCGEEGGHPPPGFDDGNSPVALAGRDLRGRSVVFVTTNGTRALRLAATARGVLAASFLNATAAVRTALAAWEAGGGTGRLVVLCAGRRGDFGLDDAVCAGYLVERVLDQVTARLDDGAMAAHRLWRSFGDPLAALRASQHGQELMALGYGEDLAFCARCDWTAVVPAVGEVTPWPLRLL